MKATITQKVEIEISTVDISVPVRFADEDMPYDFPHRVGNVWNITVDVDTGKIHDWPNRPARLAMKVCDEGIYILRDCSGKTLARRISDYVPHGLIPGEYGDYIVFDIDERGIITNWPKNPNVKAFFQAQED